MKKYFCDVCGAETAGGDNAPSIWAAELCGLADLCPRCEGLVKKVDVSALVRAELRRMAAEQEAPSPPTNPPPSPKGKADREKRDILAAVENFRQERGPGATLTLAKLAKVSESELRTMLACEPVPITVWRKVGYNAGLDRALYSIAYAKTVCLQSSEPLTLEELREMDGQPVWVELIGLKRPSAWYLLNLRDKEAVNKRGGFVSLIYYGDTWLAYRRKPEEGRP